MSTLMNNTPGRPASPYDFGRFGSQDDVTGLLQSKRLKNPNTFARLMGPGLAQEFGFYNENTFGRLGALSNAADALDPANRGALVNSFAGNAMGQVPGNTRRMQNSLFGQLGAAPGVGAGAELESIGRAQGQIGQFRNQLYSPFNLANSYLGQANALGAGNVFQGLPLAMQAMGIAGQQPKSPTFMDTVTGLAGSAFAGGWKPF